MVGARVRGTTDFRGCRLRVPAPVDKVGAHRQHADRYALSLASAEIDGRLLLDHQFTALGGVSLYQATIRNSLSLNTARLESRRHDVPALDAEDMRLVGSMIWVNPSPSEQPMSNQWNIAGRMVLRRAEIGSDVKLEHCRWAVAGAISLADPPDRSNRVKVDHISGGIDARACNVSGQFRIGEGCLVARWKAPPSRRVNEDVGSGVYGAALDGWKMSIGKGVRIEGGKVPARFTGPILLNDSNVSHGIIMLGQVHLPSLDVATEKIAEAFDLSDAQVTGLVRMRCKLSGSLNLRRSSIDGTLELQRIEYNRPALLPGNCSKDCKTGTATVLDLSSATVSGALHLGGLSMDEESRAVWRLMEGIRRAEVLDRTLGKFVDLYRIHQRVAVFRTADILGGEVLSGSARQLRRLFAEHAPVQNDELVRAFVLLHFEHVVNDLGPRTIGTLPPAEEQDDGWLFRDCEYAFNGNWHKADLHVARNYRIERLNERQTARDDAVVTEFMYRVGPFRFLPANHDLVTGIEKGVTSENDPQVLEALRIYACENFARPVVIDLRGLTCRAFDDNDASVWEQLGDQREWRLLLDGINFVQLDRTDPKERSKGSNADEEESGADSDHVTARPLPGDQSGGAMPDSPLEENALLKPAILREHRRKMLHAFSAGQRVKRWRRISNLATDSEFSPQPFETFARAYAQSGEHSMAETIISAQKRLQWMRISKASRHSIRSRSTRAAMLTVLWALPFAILTVIATGPWPTLSLSNSLFSALFVTWLFFYLAVQIWPWILLSAGWLFDVGFRFGLRPASAVQTFLLCLLAGAAGTIALRHEIKPVDQFHFVPVSQRLESKGEFRVAARAKIPTDVAVEGCNVVSDSVVDRAIYAFDVFVPLIDVRQECGFTIKDTSGWVRVLKSIYAALGWVVVSLTLLTISGMLRRDIEK
jgi:hypothetical protein